MLMHLRERFSEHRVHARFRFLFGVFRVEAARDVLGDRHVGLCGDFEIRFGSGDNGDRLVRQIVHHHAGVVGRVEVRVGGGELVGFGDSAETEGLRGLRAECVRTIGHGAR